MGTLGTLWGDVEWGWGGRISQEKRQGPHHQKYAEMVG